MTERMPNSPRPVMVCDRQRITGPAPKIDDYLL
jgi:hypothetical protein